MTDHDPDGGTVVAVDPGDGGAITSEADLEETAKDAASFLMDYQRMSAMTRLAWRCSREHPGHEATVIVLRGRAMCWFGTVMVWAFYGLYPFLWLLQRVLEHGQDDEHEDHE
jgi:hypothetical protein